MHVLSAPVPTGVDDAQQDTDSAVEPVEDVLTAHELGAAEFALARATERLGRLLGSRARFVQNRSALALIAPVPAIQFSRVCGG